MVKFYVLYMLLCAQSFSALCNPMDCSPPGSSVHGILQARILEKVAMPSSRGSSQPKDRTCISYISCIGGWVLYHQRHLGNPMIWQTIFFLHNTNEKVMWQLQGSLHKGQPHSACALFFAFFFYLARKVDRMYEALDAILSHEEKGHILRMAMYLLKPQ